MLLQRINDYEQIYGAFDELKENFFNFNGDLKEFSSKVYKHGVCFVARTDKIAGLIAFYANDYISKKAFITSILVSETERGKGIGTKLIKCAEEICEIEGFKKVCLEVNADNVIAIDFYKRLGYTQFKSVGESVFMEKPLN